MSRTDKTMPIDLQREDGAVWWQWGGIWRGAKEARRRHNRSDRATARQQLRLGQDVEPRQHRHRAQWDLY